MAQMMRWMWEMLARVGRIDLIRVFSMTSLATLVRMCTGLVSVKVVALIIGPAGVALLGQFNNFSTIVQSLSTGGISWGVTKYVSEHRADHSKIKGYLSTALRITLMCTLLCSVAMIVLHRPLSRLVMLSDDYGYVFLIFGFTLVLYTLNGLLLSIVNGYQEYTRFVYINIANSLVGVAFTVILVLFWDLRGALIASVTFQSVVFFVTLWMLRHTPWLHRDFFREKFSRIIAGKYFRFTLMALTSALLVPVSQMVLRGYVISEISSVEAGWWEGMMRISSMYLMVVTSSLGAYYIPRLSELHDPAEVRDEIMKAYKVIVPLLGLCCVLIYLLRYLVVYLLFSEEFMPMTELFGWQLAGDFFKICSWILASQMIAKAMTRTFIVTEILSSGLWVGLGFIFVHINGITGICQAYLLNYIVYLVMMIFVFRKSLTLKA